MSLLLHALPGVFGPAVLCGLVALLARPWAAEGSRAAGRAFLALGVAGGYALGYRLVLGAWPPLPFADATLSAQQWRVWICALGAGVALVLVLARLRAFLAWVVRAAYVAVGLRAVLDARFRYAWEPAEGALYLALLVLATLVAWGAVERRAARGSVFPLVELWFVTSATAVAFQLARSSSNAQLAGSLAGALGAAAVAAALWSRVGAAPGATAVAAPLVAAMLVEGTVFGDVPIATAAVLAAAPLARAGVARLAGARPATSSRAERSVRVELAATAAVALVGVLVAVLTTPERTPYLPG